MLLYGVSALMFGTLLPELMRSFTLSMSRGGLIVTVQSIGGLVVAIAGVGLGDRIKKGPAIVLAFGGLGLSLVVTGAASSYWIVLASFFCAGLCQRLLDTMLNALIGEAHTTRRGFYMNILHLFFGIGAFAGPLLARTILNAGIAWSGVYFIVGGAYLVAVVPGVAILKHTGMTGKSAATHISWSLRSRPALFGLGFCLLFYVMHQSGVSSWFPFFFEAELGADADLASAALSVYWVGIILSRLLASRVSLRVRPSVLVIGGALVGGIVLFLGLVVGGGLFITLAAFATGILTGCIIPLCLVVAHDWYHQNTGSVTSLLAFFMLAGRLFAPWVMGKLGDGLSLGSSMYVTVLALLLCAVSMVSAQAVHKREQVVP
jgi:fucose permease